jgi:hypothetical protein
MIKRLLNNEKLVPGRFYRSWDGEAWCCYKATASLPAHRRVKARNEALAKERGLK